MHPLLSSARSRLASGLASRVGRPAPVDHRVTYDRLAELASRYRDTLDVGRGLASYEARVLSQNGEDGIIAEILSRIGRATGTFVEFGIGSGIEGNCVLLADAFGWSGLFMEADPDGFAGLQAKYGQHLRIQLRNTMVTPDNIDRLIGDADLGSELDILSIDIDGNDYCVWEAVTAVRPRLVIIEYNSNLPLDSRLVRAERPGQHWDGRSDAFGASLGALEALARAKGYQLAHTDLAGINAFFVRDDLAGALGIDQPERRSANYYLSAGGFPKSADDGWIDPTGDLRPAPVSAPAPPSTH